MIDTDQVGAFYAFMQEREAIRLRKEAGLPRPWTDDPILSKYKFTNVKRDHDRTTTVLREEFYPKKAWGQWTRHELQTLFLNCAIARYFGTYEFCLALGYQEEWDPYEIIDLAFERLAAKERVFTGAYVITNQGKSDPKQEVVVWHCLSPLEKVIPELVELVEQTKSWEIVVTRMMKIQGFGGSGFMAKETILDFIMASGWKPNDWDTWTPSGPGARRGIARLMGIDDMNSKEAGRLQRLPNVVLNAMRAIYARRSEFWPATYVELDLTDIQFQLCEFDKYSRVRLGQGKPRSLYKG
jgi:hypothetical protein